MLFYILQPALLQTFFENMGLKAKNFYKFLDIIESWWPSG